MKTCPACRKQIDVEASRCPYCSTAFDAGTMRAGYEEVAGRRRRQMIALGVAIAAAFAWLAWPGNVERLATWTAEQDAR